MSIIPVILSGGSGTRLWPVSRANSPKQLTALTGGESLLKQTLRRTGGLAGYSHSIVVCNRAHRFQVAEQFRELGGDRASILLEPCGRNTAPAIAIAAMQALQTAEEPVMLVLPSDHLLPDVAAFESAVRSALPKAQAGSLVTFGVKPTGPATGYGYIRAAGRGISSVEQFTEKPAREVAEDYIRQGNYYWNSGMFLFKARAYLDALAEFAPAIAEFSRLAFDGVERDRDFLRIPETEFSQCPSDSIDYAVMEKTKKAVVVPLDAGWSDLGTWDSLWDAEVKDAHDNAVIGDVLTHRTRGSYIRADSRLVGSVGVENLVIVETADAVLVADRRCSEDIKPLVARLSELGRREADDHKQVYRSWGGYEIIDQGERFKVRRLTVKPGAGPARKMHRHRGEHWIVVKGEALVSRGDEQFSLGVDESTYIPPETEHKLDNRGSETLELIEIQSGDQTSEADMVRLDADEGAYT